jgi:hypothetical protein
MSDQNEVPDPYVERTVSVRPGASASASACVCCSLASGTVVEVDGWAVGVGVPDAVGVGETVEGAGLAVPDGVGLVGSA